jgi:hypothetical protein
MGMRSSRQEVKVPHFFFGEVTQKTEYNREIITVTKNMLRSDEYEEWVRIYTDVKGLQHESLLIPTNYEIEEVKKYMACCECPGDFEIAVSYSLYS